MVKKTEGNVPKSKLMSSGEMIANTKSSKNYITGKINEQRKHELELALIKAMGDNPDLPYIAIALGGAAAAIAAKAFEDFEKKMTGTEEVKKAAIDDFGDTLLNIFRASTELGSPIFGSLVADKVDTLFGKDTEPKTLVGLASRGIAAGAVSTSTAAWVAIYLRCIFGSGGTTLDVL